MRINRPSWPTIAWSLAGVAAAATLVRYIPGTRRHRIPARRMHIETSRAFNRSSALLACSVLTDSAMEHYRGSFSNPAMYIPPVVATFSLLAGLHGGADQNTRTHAVRHAIYWGAALTGVAGTGFHIYNVMKRPGGWSWQNLFYAAPLGAPAALLLSGALGAAAERLRNEPARSPRLLGMPAGKALGLLSGMGLAGTAGEAALLHFRGSFQHKAMYAPVSVPPAASALLLHASLTKPQPRWLARVALQLTWLIGWLGAAFHIRGVARHHGGWRNWSQNIYNGPPLPAPPSFAALALAGLAALRLRERERR
ncbi:hypothetical protein [Dyella sp.]|uniref:hypothetical protein n=1 Tax=Dyella sp. TaxID=1869338 RepID=UPI002B472E1E|nr:hypothetical protein [Dyella sp.]HKT28524.1 hypothetical protein [Dyella sp.]